MPSKILNIAHRGFSEKFPENTLAAFKAALELGVDMIELDVHLSQDRHVVVHHDDALGRTNNGHGLLKEHSLEALKALDAGSWFDSQFSQETLPLLEDVLDLVAGRAWVNIEIKASAYEEKETPDGIEQQVVRLVQAKGLVGTTLISSFQPNCLRRVNQMPDAPPVALLDEGNQKNLGLIEEIQPYSYHTFYRTLSLDEVEHVHQAQLPLFVFTVNAPHEMKTMLHMGVDGVITNAPHTLQTILNCWEKDATPQKQY